MKLSEITLICPRNDLESETIWEIAGQYNIHRINAGNQWGIRLDNLQLRISDLRKTVVVIETPGVETTEWLKRHGKDVVHIDHHQYSDLENTRNLLSSLEQFAQLINHPLTEHEKRVAINDRLFIPGLQALGCTYQEMCEIRSLEAKVRNVEALRDKAFKLKSSCFDFSRSNFDIYKCPAQLSPVFSEVAQFPNEITYNKALKKKRLILPNVLIFYEDECNVLDSVSVCVNNTEVKALESLFNKISSQYSVKSWFANNIDSAFFGVDLRESDLEIKQAIAFQIKQLVG